MQNFVFALLFSLLPLAASAEEITNELTESQASIARVVQVTNVANRDGILVNVAVQDMGGSTDVSPTQRVYLTLYRKGEMFSTGAAFLLRDVLSFRSARRLPNGLIEVRVTEYTDTIENVTYLVDARSAVAAMLRVECDDFDCDASNNFTATISMRRK